MDKLTLVIDGNWLLISRFFMARDGFRKEFDDKILQASAEGLADTMAQSISVLLRQFQDTITNIVLVSDNRSWRKELTIPACVGGTYKGTRTQDSDYNWTYIFKSISILTQRLKKLGITTSNAYGVEGDDWCWWWSRKLNAEGTNVILWTIDEDIQQLVQKDEDTGAFTGWYEKGKGLILSQSMQTEPEPDDDFDFFMTPIKPTNNLVTNLSRIVKVSYINPINIINKKILIGDNSDNILPVFTYLKNSKTYKATERDWQKIANFDDLIYNNEMTDNDLIKLYRSIYNIKNKQLGLEFTSQSDFLEHIKYNRKLVWINESQIPENIQSQMTTCEYNEISADLMHDIKFNWRTIANRTNEEELANLFEEEPNFV